MSELKIGEYTIQTQNYYDALMENNCTTNEMLAKLDTNGDKTLTEDELVSVDSDALSEFEENENTSNTNSSNKSQLEQLEDSYQAQLKFLYEQLQNLYDQRRELLNKIGESSNLEDLKSRYSEVENMSDQIKNMQTQIITCMTNYDTQVKSIQAAMASSNSSSTSSTAKTSSASGGSSMSENYNFDYNFTTTLTDQQKSDLDYFESIYNENKDKYLAVEKATGVPAELVAAIHWRESGCRFDTYLHNGDPLGQPTTHVPQGIYFEDWTEAAIDAINSIGLSVEAGNIESYYEYAERYNGLGYRNKGVASPYVWSGTSNYTGGKYVADGVYDASAFDQQLGVAVMLQRLLG